MEIARLGLIYSQGRFAINPIYLLAIYSVSVATEGTAVVTEEVSVVTAEAAVATEKVSVATERAAVATEKVSVATEGTAVVTEKVSVATEEAAVATEKAILHLNLTKGGLINSNINH